MTGVATLAIRVREHWLSHGLGVSPVPSAELTELKRRRPEGIPEAYEEFLLIAGLPAGDDEQGFRFWLPREVAATRDVLEASGYRSNATESSLIIADYLQESWWYALWLAGPFRGSVSLVLGVENGTDPQPPLGTFNEFLFAYLNDDAILYRGTHSVP